MSDQLIHIGLQLEITPDHKVLIPGCEPTSALSSASLSFNLAEFGCGDALADVNEVLTAIPGSFIKLGANFNRGNTRQKWLVLPPIGTDCPCKDNKDYYNILKSLSSEATQVDDIKDYCDINDMGYCPSPDFDQASPPDVDPYKDEGTFPANIGVLPPVPPWGQSGT